MYCLLWAFSLRKEFFWMDYFLSTFLSFKVIKSQWYLRCATTCLVPIASCFDSDNKAFFSKYYYDHFFRNPLPNKHFFWSDHKITYVFSILLNSIFGSKWKTPRNKSSNPRKKVNGDGSVWVGIDDLSPSLLSWWFVSMFFIIVEEFWSKTRIQDSFGYRNWNWNCEPN